MSEDEMPPMDGDLRALLRRGAPPLECPADVEARLLARVTASVAGPGARGGGGDGDGGAAQAPPPTSPIAAASTTGTAALTTKLVGPVVASLLVGGVVGGAIVHTVDSASVRVVYVDRPSSRSAALESPPSVDPSISARVEDLPRADGPTPSQAARPPSSAAPSSLAAERQVLDRAREAFARGDHERTLSLIADHARAHPEGALREEREALAVRALAAAGKVDAARDRGARFVARYPQSLMRPAVEAATAVDRADR